MPHKPLKRVKKLTAEQKKVVWKKPSNWTQVVGSNTFNNGGRSPMRSVDPDPRHPIKDDTIK